MIYHTEILILGGGMVGLSIANQILERDLSKKIIILDKEDRLGLHSSGRNSGVLHAGLYYKPGSLKAKVCIDGAKRLRKWVEERGLPLNPCGKVIVPQDEELDSQLDLLAARGSTNGATVEFLDEDQLRELIPEAKSSTGRALWSPNTAVVKPIAVINQLKAELERKGVVFLQGLKDWSVTPRDREIRFKNGGLITYGHIFNCSGLQADRVAHLFGVGHNYTLLPFKGLYWQLRKDCPFKPKTNLYPVPDLSVPFLGVHFTPSADSDPYVSIGPTASPAWGRENYRGFEGIEPSMALKNLSILGSQYIFNRGRFQNYVHQQAFLSLEPFLIKAAQKLVPSLKSSHIELSQKVGIRSQLFNCQTKLLEDDFICIDGSFSTHVLNAISPAFTASFSLADLIIDRSSFCL